MEYVGPLVRFAVESGKITDEVVKPKLLAQFATRMHL